MNTKVLLVDDEENVLNGLKRRFRRQFDIDTATSAEDGLARLQTSGPYAVIVSDQQMPGMDGIAFLKQAMDGFPHTVRIMLTGGADRQIAVDSVNECQVFRYLKKPCSLDDLGQAIEDGIGQHRVMVAERDLLQKTLAGSVKLLVDILAINDARTFKHIGRIRKLAQQFSSVVEDVNAWELDMTIMLSTIGEVALPPDVRAKHERGEELSQIEANLIASAPKVARDLLLNIPRMNSIADAVYYRDKAFDGSGYPFDTTKGNDIPLNARILFLLQGLIQTTGGGAPKTEDFDKLAQSQDRYDPRLLSLARGFFLDRDRSEEGELVNLSIAISELSDGDILLQDLRTDSGSLALAAQNEVTEANLQKIMNFHELHGLVEPIRVQRRLTSDETIAAVRAN